MAGKTMVDLSKIDPKEITYGNANPHRLVKCKNVLKIVRLLDCR
jgi:hypothetical protein